MSNGKSPRAVSKNFSGLLGETLAPKGFMAAQAHVSILDMPAQARANRSFLPRLMDAIIQSRRRKAEEFMAEYDRVHEDDLAAQHMDE